MNQELADLLEVGSQHGMALPERMILEKALIDAGLGEHLHAFRRMTAFVKSEEILTAENVRGFLRSMGRDRVGGVAGKALALGWNADVEPDIEKDTTPSPGYQQGPDYPRTPRRKPVPIGSDLSAILRADPLAKNFEAVNGRVMVDGSTMVRFIDGSGKSKIKRVAVRKPKVAPALKATAPVAKVSIPAPAPAPDRKALATANADWKELFSLDPSIREEFINAEVFDAFKRAEQAGRIRICGLKRN